MSLRTSVLRLPPLWGILFFGGHVIFASVNDVTLYTPYTRISVPPGESIDYTIDVINKGNSVRKMDLSITGLPQGWDYDLKYGSWKIGQLAVLPDEKKSVTLHVEVPQDVNKGTYRFNVVARGVYALPLTVIVSEQGTFKTEFTTRQPNMEGNASSSFTFSAELRNRTADKQLYALRAEVQRGWSVTFRSAGKQVTSVQVEPNATENVTIEIKPPDAISAGSYKVPVIASTSTTTANLELEIVITGSYVMELTTPTGLLSTSVTAGDERRLELVVRNKGSAELKDIKLNFTAPLNWDVTFDPKSIDKLEPGKTMQAFATIKADKNAIAGDYVTNLEAKTPETSSLSVIRVSVRTPTLLGWAGALIILVAMGSVYSMFRRYGRR